MAKLSDKQAELFRGKNWGTVVTLRKDGSPHSTPVWIDTDGENVIFNTSVGRAKERYLRQDPRASLIVVDPHDPYRWVSVAGRAELSTEGADAEIDKLAKKYLGKDEYPWRNPSEQRIKVRITAEKVEATGLGD